MSIFYPLHLWWWQYVLEKRVSNDVSWFTTIWCRMRGHPEGIVFYNFSGYEPDYSLKNCGDDLG